MKKIAIISSSEVFDNYGDDYQLVAQSITDWSEVSDDDYSLLRSFCGNGNSYTLINREDVKETFIPRLVSEFTALAKVEKEKQELEKKKREEAKLNRELKKKAKTEEQERKLFESLKTKFAE